MKLHNTLTRQVEEIDVIQAGKISIYTCGPTLYDHIHIGNLASFIIADSLRRALSLAGVATRQVMNFTDVDDKTIRRSQENSPDLEPMEALLKLTRHYGELFINDFNKVGNDSQAVSFVRATDSISDMQDLIIELHKQGFAYVTDDGVYFSIQAYQDSGKTYGQLTEITSDSTGAARIQNDEYDKVAPHDFALWKTQKPHEPAWDFELEGKDLSGRPGWHIECSAMSTKQLGQPFDIHTGGVDLIFPHHENEIAQSTAGKDTVYARLFVHNEHLLVDGQKMSKSLDNFYTLDDLKSKGYEPLAFRLLVLQAHYRTQAHFSWNNLEAAQNRLNGYRAMADQYWQPRSDGGLDASELQTHMDAISTALFDDLDTPTALAALSALEAAIDNSGINTSCQVAYGEALSRLDAALGLQLRAADLSDDQKQLIKDRQSARAAQDWSRADELRDELKRLGITVNDSESGTIWTLRR